MRKNEPHVSEGVRLGVEMSEWRQKYFDLLSQYTTLEKSYEDNLHSLRTLNQLSSLAQMSGIFNIRFIQENELVQTALTRAVIARLQFLLEPEEKNS